MNIMLCEKCKKNNATVFYEETVNGKTRSYSLCTECAKALEQSGEIAFKQNIADDFFGIPSFGNIQGSLFGSLFGLPENARTSRKTCPLCHASFEDFRRYGKAGCPLCYTTFADELSGTVRSIHGSVKHVGRAPKRFQKQNEQKNRLTELKNELRSAIADENFEAAASLRDQIRALENDT